MNIITQVILPLGLAIIMFSMGLDLKTSDFKRIGRFPKAFFAGFFLQVIALPSLAFALAHWRFGLEFDPAYSVGLIIIAACPGGVTSNLMTHMAKGDTALSIALTAVISVLSVFTLPFIVNLGLTQFMGAESETALPIAKTIVGIFLITTVPVALGMWLNHKKNSWAVKWEPVFRKMAGFLFVIIVTAAVTKDWNLVVQGFDILGPLIIALNLGAMAMAFFTAKVLKLGLSQVTALTYECGFQNGTLAILVSLTFLGNEMMMIPGGVYSVIMFFTAGAYLLFVRKFYCSKQ